MTQTTSPGLALLAAVGAPEHSIGHKNWCTAVYKISMSSNEASPLPIQPSADYLVTVTRPKATYLFSNGSQDYPSLEQILHLSHIPRLGNESWISGCCGRRVDQCAKPPGLLICINGINYAKDFAHPSSLEFTNVI